MVACGLTFEEARDALNNAWGWGWNQKPKHWAIGLGNSCLGLVSLAATPGPPSILLVCHEAYEIASGHYSRALGTQCGVSQTWFNYEHDTLFLGDIKSSKVWYVMYGCADREKVRNIALLWDLQGTNRGSFERLILKAVMAIFRNLKRMSLVDASTSFDLAGADHKLFTAQGTLGLSSKFHVTRRLTTLSNHAVERGRPRPQVPEIDIKTMVGPERVAWSQGRRLQELEM